MATKEELLERAKELDISGRSTMSKEELEQAVAEAEGSDERATVGSESEASDADNPEVVENLSDSGQEALDELGEASKDEADLALDASGPLVLQSPHERRMTGAVSEEQAKEQEAVINLPDEGHAGHLSEAGEPLGVTEERDVKQEDVIDFPPPVGEREGSDEPIRETSNFQQKSVLYTDGISGTADSNLERAYEIPEVLQSNNPVERAAGDESLSEASKEAKTDEELERAEEVKSREPEGDDE